MSPQQSFHMPSTHDRVGHNLNNNCDNCNIQHNNAKYYIYIVSYRRHWYRPLGSQSTNWLNRHRPKEIVSIAGRLGTGFRSVGSVPPNRSSVQNWPPGIGCDPVCKAPPGKPPGYRLLVNKSKDPPDINSTILNNLNRRNRSLIPKSRERSCRQGGRWGDKT